MTDQPSVPSSLMPTTIGNMVRLIREEKRMKLKDVALVTGLSVSYLSDIELNRTIPSLDVLNRIAVALGHILKIELSERHDTTIPASPAEIELLAAVRRKDYGSFMATAMALMGDGTND